MRRGEHGGERGWGQLIGTLPEEGFRNTLGEDTLHALIVGRRTSVPTPGSQSPGGGSGPLLAANRDPRHSSGYRGGYNIVQLLCRDSPSVEDNIQDGAVQPFT